MVREYRICPVTDIMCPNPACYWHCEKPDASDKIVPMIDWEKQNKDAQMILRLAQILHQRAYTFLPWENLRQETMDIWIAESRRILEEIGAIPR